MNIGRQIPAVKQTMAINVLNVALETFVNMVPKVAVIIDAFINAISVIRVYIEPKELTQIVC